MFRTSICPSSGVQVGCCCIWCAAVGVGAVVLRSRSDTNLYTVHKTTHRLLWTTATTPNAEHHMQQHTTCTSEDGHIDVRNM